MVPDPTKHTGRWIVYRQIDGVREYDAPAHAHTMAKTAGKSKEKYQDQFRHSCGQDKKEDSLLLNRLSFRLEIYPLQMSKSALEFSQGGSHENLHGILVETLHQVLNYPMDNLVNYKQILLNIEPRIPPDHRTAIEAVHAEIPADDLYLEVIDNNVILYLNRVNMDVLIQLRDRFPGSILTQVAEAVSSIKSYGIKGRKRIFVDYNAERKVQNRKKKEESRGKYFYANDHPFQTMVNEIPGSLVNRIICGDSETILTLLPDNCIDLVFTSPPYNFGLDYHEQEDEHFWEKYFDKLICVFRECIRVLKFGGRIIVNIQPMFSDYIPSHHMISRFFLEEKLIWKGEILWEKNNYNCKYTAWGSWKSPSSPYLKYTWEFLEIFCKGDLKKAGDRDNIDITDEEFKAWVVAKWSIAPERKMKKTGHPAMFPEELVRRVLKLFSYQRDIILDPFNGAGTTTAVAKSMNRRFLGIDISDEYCQKAENRL